MLDFPGFATRSVRPARCAAPVHFFILGLASFEELVLRRLEELCGPLQHRIIAIIVSRDHTKRLGATAQL